MDVLMFIMIVCVYMFRMKLETIYSACDRGFGRNLFNIAVKVISYTPDSGLYLKNCLNCNMGVGFSMNKYIHSSLVLT